MCSYCFLEWPSIVGRILFAFVFELSNFMKFHPHCVMTLSATGSFGAIASTAHPRNHWDTCGMAFLGIIPGRLMKSTINRTDPKLVEVFLTRHQEVEYVECISVFRPCPSLTARLGTEQRHPALCRDLWSQDAKSAMVLHLGGP